MSDQQVPPPPVPPPPPPPSYSPPPPPSYSPPPSSSAGGASENRGVMIVLSYLGILALIPFLIEKEDKEVKWHSRHGLVLVGAEVVLWIALVILSIVVGAISDALGCVFSILFLLLALGLLGFHVLLIVKGLNGERVMVPYLSELADRL